MIVHKVILDKNYVWRIKKLVVQPGDLLFYESYETHGIPFIYIVIKAIETGSYLSVVLLTNETTIGKCNILYDKNT